MTAEQRSMMASVVGAGLVAGAGIGLLVGLLLDPSGMGLAVGIVAGAAIGLIVAAAVVARRGGSSP